MQIDRLLENLDIAKMDSRAKCATLSLILLSDATMTYLIIARHLGVPVGVLLLGMLLIPWVFIGLRLATYDPKPKA